MFPATSNSDNPIELLFKMSSFLCDSHIDDDDDPPFFFNFPSPFSIDEHELPLNDQNQINNNMATDDHHQILNNVDSKKQETSIVNGASNQPLKRSAAKRNDRHSKICTAQGVRDRRMRLSLQVARKFFDLHDILGYDKASKTIEWLFTESSKAIKELTKNINPVNNTLTESESAGIEENSSKKFCSNPCKKLGIRKSVKRAYNMRESRDKARARARCRTREKMMIKANPNHNQNEGVNQESNFVNQESVPLIEEQLSDEGIFEKLLQPWEDLYYD